MAVIEIKNIEAEISLLFASDFGEPESRPGTRVGTAWSKVE
jgi:hypothetical protein